MGFCTAGIVFRNAEHLSDESILDALEKSDYCRTSAISMEEASSTEYRGVGIGRTDNLAILFSKDLLYTCSFGETEVSDLEERLQDLSRNGGILCFGLDSISDTYGWALFEAGERVAGMSASDGVVLSVYGRAAKYDPSSVPNEDAVVRVIEQFSGYKWVELLFDKHIVAKSFRK